ncbi:hypothetical protein [Niabella beijingensis]|uniref:hypothetical protein n=1 Tax=Niabella beijingensis TaxID=2872700 RepID=UPI001CBDE830|nr:hypothetical protein [Niabella beijingensis]MBZ4190192.1 hypothetical protein [Niabella beijingensis]
MKKPILLLLLICLYVSGRSQKPFIQELLNTGSIEFPEKPEADSVEGVLTYSQLTDSANYIVAMTDFAKSIPDQRPVTNVKAYYNSLIQALRKKNLGKISLVQHCTVNGFPGIDYEITSKKYSDVPVTSISRTVLVNNVLIAVALNVRADQKSAYTARKDRFFRSLTITAPKPPSAAERIGYKLGWIIGKFGSIALLLAIGAGIVLLFKKKKAKSLPIE